MTTTMTKTLKKEKTSYWTRTTKVEETTGHL